MISNLLHWILQQPFKDPYIKRVLKGDYFIETMNSLETWINEPLNVVQESHTLSYIQERLQYSNILI